MSLILAEKLSSKWGNVPFDVLFNTGHPIVERDMHTNQQGTSKTEKRKAQNTKNGPNRKQQGEERMG